MWFDDQPASRLSPGWVVPPLSRVPDVPQQVSVASDLARQVATKGLGPQALAEDVGWDIEETYLAASSGGLRAMLVPLLTGGFKVLIDPRLTPKEHTEGLCPETVRAVRIAHELGHTAFYRAGDPPLRVATATLEEEDFCDLFALALVDATAQMKQ